MGSRACSVDGHATLQPGGEPPTMTHSSSEGSRSLSSEIIAPRGDLNVRADSYFPRKLSRKPKLSRTLASPHAADQPESIPVTTKTSGPICPAIVRASDSKLSTVPVNKVDIERLPVAKYTRTAHLSETSPLSSIRASSQLTASDIVFRRFAKDCGLTEALFWATQLGIKP